LESQAHTFARSIDVRFATWDKIDFETSVWNDLTMSRWFQQRVILREVRKYTGRSQDSFFPSPHPNKPLSENTLNKSIWALGYKGKHCSHGFRSSASTILNESKKYDRDVIEFQLAHLVGSETRRAYNRAQWREQRVQMMHDWANMIAEMREKAAFGDYEQTAKHLSSPAWICEECACKETILRRGNHRRSHQDSVDTSARTENANQELSASYVRRCPFDLGYAGSTRYLKAPYQIGFPACNGGYYGRASNPGGVRRLACVGWSSPRM
jgi:hypothetical protein